MCGLDELDSLGQRRVGTVMMRRYETLGPYVNWVCTTEGET